ncbi:hypothetical protein JW968_03855 [Candidatus Woesearchaeota archaeon]|nr:hypothetical protein [Candidatus Woesearchaeota archaeon]
MDKKILSEFKFGDWDNQWAGSWEIVSITDWGRFYCRKPFSKYADSYVDHTIIFWENGKSSAYHRRYYKERFAKKIIKCIMTDEKFADKLCAELKSRTDEYLDTAKKLVGKDITYSQFKGYSDLILDYYPPHVTIKVMIDFLPKNLLDKYFERFQEARVYAEPVFGKTIEFMNKLAEIHAKKTGYPAELIKTMTRDEFDAYLQGKGLPSKEILEERNKKSAFLFHNKELLVVTGKDADLVEDIVLGEKHQDEIKGSSAYPGKAKGRVKIVMDPEKTAGFKEGDILVAGMTRPEYVPLMEKAAAIVTDGGGILCHAAIVARELKKPCVIGTKVATKVFKDGDLVEVDANKGVVRKI